MNKQYTAKKYFIIAGEASGDLLGAKLIHSLKKLNSQIEFKGIGGKHMASEGLNSLFSMHELSIMGFVEILPHIPNILSRIRQTVDYIQKWQPDVVITIDSPGFCLRVAKKLQNTNIKLVHYVAPSVWAYKPKRAKVFASIYDHLLALLPFEPDYFTREGLASTFIGHPVVEEDFTSVEPATFRTKYNINHDQQIIAITPGSRKGEINRLLPIFLESIKIIKQQISNIYPVIVATPELETIIRQMTSPADILIISDKEDKKACFKAAQMVIAKSGTNTLEIAMAGAPMITAYKVNPLSAILLKIMIKTPYVNIINILANHEIIPELLQENCTPEKIAESALNLINNQQLCTEQVKLNTLQLAKLGLGSKPNPSEKAAHKLIEIIS
jgi:lipid-A-disaccharide synthase